MRNRIRFDAELLSTLNKYFEYDETTGNLIYKINTGKSKIGDTAGCLYKTPDNVYRLIRIDGRCMLAHRAIYAMKTNSDVPRGIIVEHRNCNGLDNRWCNLRLATNTENAQNIGKRRGKYSKHKGVSYSIKDNVFVSWIRVDGKNLFLGGYKNEEDAAQMYDIAAILCFKDFSNTNNVKFVDYKDLKCVVEFDNTSFLNMSSKGRRDTIKTFIEEFLHG